MGHVSRHKCWDFIWKKYFPWASWGCVVRGKVETLCVCTCMWAYRSYRTVCGCLWLYGLRSFSGKDKVRLTEMWQKAMFVVKDFPGWAMYTQGRRFGKVVWEVNWELDWEVQSFSSMCQRWPGRHPGAELHLQGCLSVWRMAFFPLFIWNYPYYLYL